MNKLNNESTPIYIYNKSKLPIEGWMQSCILCYSITGQTEEYTNEFELGKNYVVYVCRSCKYRKNKNIIVNIDYIKNVKKRIRHLRYIEYIQSFKYNIDLNQTPVDPKPPSPLIVSPNSERSSTRETLIGSRLGEQI